jgi:hypothetical protein
VNVASAQTAPTIGRNRVNRLPHLQAATSPATALSPSEMDETGPIRFPGATGGAGATASPATTIAANCQGFGAFDTKASAATAIEPTSGASFAEFIELLYDDSDPHDVVSVRTILRAKALLDQAMAHWLAPKWPKPHITKSPMGDIVLEWWAGTRKLTVYVAEQSLGYVKVWGSDIDSEMTDGDIAGGGELANLLTWLSYRAK